MSLLFRRLAGAALCLAAGLAGTVLLSPAAQAAPGLTGQQNVFASTAKTAGMKKTKTVSCPAGKVAIGAGAHVDGPNHVRITLIRAVGDGNYAEAAAVNPWGRTAWSLEVHALCAHAPKGLEYVSGNNGPGPGPTRTAIATCSAGKQVLGVGGLAAAQPDRNVTLSTLHPGRDQSSVWVGANAAEGGEPDSWTTYAYATCADKLGATQAYTPGLTGTSNTVQAASAPCEPGHLTAAGASIRATAPAGTGQMGLTDVYFDSTLGEAIVLAAEDHNGYAGTWTVGSWSICA